MTDKIPKIDRVGESIPVYRPNDDMFIRGDRLKRNIPVWSKAKHAKLKVQR